MQNRRVSGAVRSVLALGLLSSLAFAAGTETKSGYFKTSDGVRLHYLEAGTGSAIVFVPGWTMPAWIWEAQIRHFAQHYHVVALDPRSQGESDKVAEGNSPERRARDIRELVDGLKLGPAVLVGWSLAVSDLLAYAEQFGGANVRAYVLVDGFAWDKPDPQFLAAIIGFYRQIQINRQNFAENFVRSMYKKPVPEDYVQRLVKASFQMPADTAIAASVGSIARADWRPAISKLDRPVLITCQAATQSMAADLIKSMVPSARLELFEHAGHALFVDDAERFNSVLEDFIVHLPLP
jgi:non-heme chloroperoxidase